MEGVKPRQVAVAIPVQSVTSSALVQDLRICLVSSRKHFGKYVLPKGGVERGESSRQAAIRELWEEAGLVANEKLDESSLSSSTEQNLTIDDHKAHKLSPGRDSSHPGFVPRATYVAHEIRVLQDGQKKDWPEQAERNRIWVSVHEAQAKIEWRKDIAALFHAWVSGLQTTIHDEAQ